MSMSENRGNAVGTGSPAPLDGMRSAERAAHRRRGVAVTALAALGLAALAVGGTRAALAPRLNALEAQAAAARAETRDALSGMVVLEQELERLNTVSRYSADYDIPADVAEVVYTAALRENLEPRVAFQLVSIESGFRQRAISPVGAIGYAQVMPATAAWLEPGVTVDDLFDRDTNLRIGFRYLRLLLDQYGDARLALLAYNRGPGVVSALMARGEDPANGYARQILGTE